MIVRFLFSAKPANQPFELIDSGSLRTDYRDKLIIDELEPVLTAGLLGEMLQIHSGWILSSGR